jgi:hypothetical protein
MENRQYLEIATCKHMYKLFAEVQMQGVWFPANNENNRQNFVNKIGG